MGGTMNIAVVLALSSTVFNTGNDLVFRKASIINRESGSLTFYFIAAIFSAVAAFLMNIVSYRGFSGLSIDSPVLLFGTINGVLSFLTFLFYMKSFSGENTSVSVTIFRMSMIPSILFAILFLGETISLRRGIAILACIVSVLMLNSWKIGKLPDMKYFIPSLIAFFTGGMLSLMNKVAIGKGCDAFSLILVRFIVVSILAGMLLVIQKSFHYNKKVLKYAAASGFLLVMGIYLMLESMKTGDLALVLPIGQLSFVMVVVISWLFLKEKMTRIKIIGVFMAIGSILLIN